MQKFFTLALATILVGTACSKKPPTLMGPAPDAISNGGFATDLVITSPIGQACDGKYVSAQLGSDRHPITFFIGVKDPQKFRDLVRNSGFGGLVDWTDHWPSNPIPIPASALVVDARYPQGPPRIIVMLGEHLELRVVLQGVHWQDVGTCGFFMAK